jgi:hypothetical protein
VNSATGEFHGTMVATTPTGSGTLLKYRPGATSAAMPTSVNAWAAL